MEQNKYLFIDRDGTLIVEPEDKQIDRIDKLAFLPGVFAALLSFKKNGYKLIMISNQDGLGTLTFPKPDFDAPHEMMLQIFASQGIVFDDIKICPHLPKDNCNCRKPEVGLVLDYLKQQKIDRESSYVIGDRATDLELAKNMGIQGILIDDNSVYETKTWQRIADSILNKPRQAKLTRITNETDIKVSVNLDNSNEIYITTGIGFFDHMLEQIAKHAQISLNLTAKGDVYIDDHHTIEDVAIVLGEVIRKALGDKLGIERYGFLLPMDESEAKVALDLSGRFSCIFKANFSRDKVGELSTELISHFFHSFAEGLKATLHIDIKGNNAHHMAEAAFKAVGRALGQAVKQTSLNLPSTKGIL